MAAAIEDAAQDLDLILSPTAPLGRNSRHPHKGGRQAMLKRSRWYMKVGDAFLQQPRSKEFPGTLWGPARQLGGGPRPTAGLCRAPRWRRPGCSPLQMKHWMWKYLFCTRSTSPLHTFPQVLHRMAVLGGFSGGLGAACGSDTAGKKEQH